MKRENFFKKSTHKMNDSIDTLSGISNEYGKEHSKDLFTLSTVKKEDIKTNKRDAKKNLLLGDFQKIDAKVIFGNKKKKFFDYLSDKLEETSAKIRSIGTGKDYVTSLNVSDGIVKRYKRTVKNYYNKVDKRKLAANWAFYSLTTFVVFSLALIFAPPNVKPHIGGKYSIYSSRPLVLGDANLQLYSKDSRSQRINEIFKNYNCPLEGFGEVFVMEADKNNIPWWIVAAISFQESTCGKYTPSINGRESYNAWGWGVWGDNTHGFDNWVRGIEQVSEYLNERFFSKGITEPCVIMRTYTPPSNGSWCEGVKFFGDQIQNYKTPVD